MAASQISSSSQLQDRTVEQARPSDTEWQDAQVGCKYVGTFEVGKGKVDRVAVKRGVAVMQQYADKARDAVLIICLEGLKVVDGRTQKVAMAHALARVSMCSVDPNHALFGFVAKNPGVLDKYCHVFAMRKQRHADEVHALVSKAFKLAFTKERTIKQSKGHARSALPGAGPGPAQPAPRAAMGTAPAGRPKRNWAKHNPLQGMNQAPTAAGGGNRLAAPGKASTPAAASPKPLRAARTQDLASAQSGSGLRTAAWYQAGLPREIAMELLELSQDGAFIVRDSQSQPGNFALTMKADNMMHHFIIRSTRGGYTLGADHLRQREFADLGSLIVHYTNSTGGCLPTTLSLEEFNTLFDDGKANKNSQEEEEEEESFVDPDYQSMKELREMMGRG